MTAETAQSESSKHSAFSDGSGTAAGVPFEAEHEEVGSVYKRDSGLSGIIAVHSTALGPSLGGTRFYPYASTAEALADVLRLSKAMSYKAALAGLDLGGGKAVIIGDPDRLKSERLLIDYAHFVSMFEGRYITAEDVGTSQADMDFLGRHTQFVTGRSESLGGSGDPSPVTAFGVVRAMEATSVAVLGGSLSGIRVAISGVGKVGGPLVRMCVERGALVTIADVSDAKVAAVLSEVAVEVVTPRDIHKVECDIYAPCALGGAVNAETFPELACRAICGAANNQLETPELETALAERGITYVPDYLANSGGVINIAYEPGGYDRETALAHVSRIFETTVSVFEEAARSGDTLSTVADRRAESRIASASRR